MNGPHAGICCPGLRGSLFDQPEKYPNFSSLSGDMKGLVRKGHNLEQSLFPLSKSRERERMFRKNRKRKQAQKASNRMAEVIVQDGMCG